MDHQSTTNNPTPLTVVVLTFNEQDNIERCLKSISDWHVEIFVLDSYSTDETLDIARRYTTNIFQHRYEGHAQQWDYALKNLPISTEWIFAMDADFQATSELKEAIAKELARNSDINGYYVRHKQIFRGKFIRFGSIYPRYWLRLFRRGTANVDANDLVDLHFYVNGTTKRIEFDVLEDNAKERDIGFWVTKQCKFAKKQALEELKRKKNAVAFPVKPSLFGTPDQRTLWLKKHWYRMPLYVRPFLYFFYRYILRFGFLDGKQGFIYHFTQAFLYRLLVDIELDTLLRESK
jgi:glycosyltransferase involved in cell wall biosynthesis